MTDHSIRSWEFNWAAEGRSPRTMREMRGFVVRFAQALDGPLATATRADCEQFIASHQSKFRANYAWRSLRSFYKFLSEDQETASPMAKVKAPKVPITDVTMIEEDDVNRMLRSCSPWSTFERARDAAIISMLWATGVRRGELAALRLDDIDIDSMTLVVRESKTGKSRRVPFDSRACGHLLRYLSQRERYAALPKAPEALWLGKAGRLGSDGIRQVVERRRDAVGIKASTHSFRRSLAARALSAGVSGASTSVLLGWAPGSIMLSRYTRMVAQETAAAEYRRAFGS